LARHDAASREAPPITNPIDLVLDGFIDPTWAQKISMQRVRGPFVRHGLLGGREGLAEHLPPKYGPPTKILALPSKRILREAFEGEQIDQLLEDGAHDEDRGTRSPRA
jgi:hypothetical protein